MDLQDRDVDIEIERREELMIRFDAALLIKQVQC